MTTTTSPKEHQKDRIVSFPSSSKSTLVRLEITNLTTTSISSDFLSKLTKSTISSTLHELSLVNVGLHDIDDLFDSSMVCSSSSAWTQLRVLDVRRNVIKRFPSILLVEICPLLFELRISGQHESCLPSQEVLRWTQASIIGHLEMENLHPDKMLAFCDDLACSCLLSISINNQKLQLNPPWCKDPHEFEERKRLIESTVLESGARPLVTRNEAGYFVENGSLPDTHHNLFANFVRTALELIQLNVVVKQAHATNKKLVAIAENDEKRDSHSVTKKISSDLSDSSLANAWFDARFQEQKKWNFVIGDETTNLLLEFLPSHEELSNATLKLYFGHGTARVSDPQHHHLLPFIDSGEFPDFVLIKASGMERRRIIMRSMMKKKQRGSSPTSRAGSADRASSVASSNPRERQPSPNPRENEKKPSTAIASPSPSVFRRPSSTKSDSSALGKTSPFVLHRTMSACGRSVRKEQEFTNFVHQQHPHDYNKRPSSVLRLMVQHHERYDDFIDEEDDDQDVFEENVGELQQQQSEPPCQKASPFRNRIFIPPSSEPLQISAIDEDELIQTHENMIRRSVNRQQRENISPSKKRPASSSSSAALKMANLRSSFKQSEFVRSDTVSVGDPILFLDPAAFGVGARYVITHRELDTKTVICERDPASFASSPALEKTLPKRLGVKMMDINRASSSWVSSKSYPPPLQLPIEADFKRGFSHDFIEIRKSFVPLHQYLRDQRHKRTEKETKKVHDLVEEISTYINLQKYGTAEKPVSSAEVYANAGNQIVSPRTILREKRRREKNEQEQLLIDFVNRSAATPSPSPAVVTSLFTERDRQEGDEKKKEALFLMVSASRTGSAMKLAEQRAKEFQNVRRTLYDGQSASAARHLAIEAERIDPKKSTNCSVSLRGLRNSTSNGKHGNQFLPLSVRSYFTTFNPS